MPTLNSLFPVPTDEPRPSEPSYHNESSESSSHGEPGPQLYDINQCPEQCSGTIPANATLFMGSHCIVGQDGPEEVWELACGAFRDEAEFYALGNDEFLSRIFTCRGQCNAAELCIDTDRGGFGIERALCYADTYL